MSAINQLEAIEARIATIEAILEGDTDSLDVSQIQALHTELLSIITQLDNMSEAVYAPQQKN